MAGITASWPTGHGGTPAAARWHGITASQATGHGRPRPMAGISASQASGHGGSRPMAEVTASQVTGYRGTPVPGRWPVSQATGRPGRWQGSPHPNQRWFVHPPEPWQQEHFLSMNQARGSSAPPNGREYRLPSKWNVGEATVQPGELCGVN